MGIFSKNRTLTNDEQENNEEQENSKEQLKKKGGFLAALFGSDKYHKTPERKAEEKEKKSLSNRLGYLKLKKYNRSMGFRYNKNKKRIEVGEDFEVKQLPGVVYSLASRSTIFRKDIGGMFDLHDRNELERIVKKNRRRVFKIEEKLREGNERRQKVSLEKLFS